MKYTNILYFVLILLLLPEISGAQTYKPFYSRKDLTANNISTQFDNYGSSLDSTRYYAAFWNTYNGMKVISYEQGIWAVGKTGGKLSACQMEWNTTYSPGPIINGVPAVLIKSQDSVRYRVYKISSGDGSNNNIDYKEWPFDLGAPKDKNGKPLLLGSQTVYTIYNGLDTVYQKRSSSRDLLSIPLEIHQTTFARGGKLSDSADIFSNTIFLEYSLINKSSSAIDSAYVGFWSDIDFYSSAYDITNLPAVDTSLQIGYCWANTASANIPAVGYTMLYGPSVSSAGKAAVFKGRLRQNYKNLPLNSFHAISDDATITGPDIPLNKLNQIWNTAKGLHPYGQVITDPVSGQKTSMPYNGDPVKGTGWIYSGPVGGGAGMVMFSGPFTLAPSDTQWVMFALVPGLGKTAKESIQLMRQKVEYLRSLSYDSLAFGSTGYKVTSGITTDKIKISQYLLEQNYPNPFNPATRITYSISEGLNVRLNVYDMLGKQVATLVNEYKPAGSHSVEFNAGSLPSGLYIYTIEAGSFRDSKKLMLLK